MSDDKRHLYALRGFRPTYDHIKHLAPSTIEDIVEADLGIEFEMLRDSDAGRALIERAMYDLGRALSGLVEVNAADTQAVTELQVQARTANRIVSYICEAISNGIQARERVEQQGDHTHDQFDD